MTGSTTAYPLDLTQGLRTRLAEAPPLASTHVETELQQIAARRLGRGSSRMEERSDGYPSGAFDSPDGFVFAADAGKRGKRLKIMPSSPRSGRVLLQKSRLPSKWAAASGRVS